MIRLSWEQRQDNILKKIRLSCEFNAENVTEAHHPTIKLKNRIRLGSTALATKLAKLSGKDIDYNVRLGVYSSLFWKNQAVRFVLMQRS